MRLPKLLLLICLAAVLVGCQANPGAVKPDLAALQAATTPAQSPALTQLPLNSCEVLTIGEEVYLDITRLEFPQGLQPLGFLDADKGYFLDAAKQEIVLYHFPSATVQTVVAMAEGSGQLGKQIAFSERWLAWVEVGEFIADAKGRLSRTSRLLAWDTSQPRSATLQVDLGRTTPAEGGFLPFDYLDIDGDYLLYRYSDFQGGWRNTQIKLADLAAGSVGSLMAATGSGGKMILSCSIAGGVAAWDLQTVVEAVVLGVPTLNTAYYDLYRYQTDPRKLAANENPVRRVTMNRAYYAPVVYRDQLLVLERLPERAAEHTMLQHIVRIDPEILTSQKLVHDSVEFTREDLLKPRSKNYRDLLLTYEELKIVRSISFAKLNVSKRFLHWESNVRDRSNVFDLQNLGLVELPLYFSGGSAVWDGLYFSRSLPGLDADYIYFELLDNAEPPYILRLQ